MGKSATDIEADIRAALRVCSLEAKGLWLVMRYVMDSSDRPGHLRQNGRPMSAVQLAREAGCTADEVARLRQELEEAGLVAVADQTMHAPMLARLAEMRSRVAARVQRHRAKGGSASRGGASSNEVASRERERRDGGALRNAGCNASSNADVTERPPPSLISLPETLSLTPTQPPAAEGARVERDEPIAAGLDAAAVVAAEEETQRLLDGEGFSASDPIRRHPMAELPQVRVAIANADYLASVGRLQNRRAYVVRAIEDRYPLAEPVYRRQMAAEKVSLAASAAEVKRQMAAREMDEERRQEEADGAALAALSAEARRELVTQVLAAANPIVRAKWEKADVMTSPGLRGAVLVKLRELEGARMEVDGK